MSCVFEHIYTYFSSLVAMIGEVFCYKRNKIPQNDIYNKR